jgi:hypothetical protein
MDTELRIELANSLDRWNARRCTGEEQLRTRPPRQPCTPVRGAVCASYQTLTKS